MKYTITITETKEEKVLKEVYVLEENRTKDHPESYRNELVDEKVSSKIYEQSREVEIDLKAIIDAFNK